MSITTTSYPIWKAGCSVALCVLGLSLTGCEPEKPVMEIRAPGVNIQVEQPVGNATTGDVKINLPKRNAKDSVNVEVNGIRPENPDEIKQ